MYGETLYDTVEQILQIVNLTPDEIFVDLGSGIGNVVIHVAGATQAKISYGIEIAERPSRYAEVTPPSVYRVISRCQADSDIFLLRREWLHHSANGWHGMGRRTGNSSSSKETSWTTDSMISSSLQT